MQRYDFFGWVTAVLLLTISSFTHAFIVTIEPDDYAAGTDLSNVSPYVTLSSRHYLYGSGDPIDNPIKATPSRPDSPVPTGDMSFGHHGFFVWPDENGDPVQGGFALTFHQEVSQVTLLANNSHYPTLSAEWIAFDRDGNRIGHGFAGGGTFGDENFLIDIRLDNLWSVVLGGHDAINAINFDHLSFDVVDVPEPGTAALLVPGLLALTLRRKVLAA